MRRKRRAQSASTALRLTIVSRIYTPEPSAGSMRLQALVTELLNRGHSITVLTTRPPKHIPVPDQNTGERIRRWPVLRDRSGYVRGYLQYLSYDVPVFFRALFSARPDAYIVEPPPTTGAVIRIAAWLRRRPYVYYAADIWSDAAQMTGAAAWVIKAVRAVEKFAIAGASENLVVSAGVVERIDTLAPRSTMVNVGHGVDTDLFSPTGAGVDDPSDIVYVGTMSEWHGASIAIDALAQVMRADATVTATFIGQGAEKEKLQAAAEAYGLASRIRFLPPVPADQAARWMRSARVALATLKPGAGYDFAVPTKIYAAIAIGTPVAYAGPQALQNVITENCLGESAGFDATDYAEAIQRLLGRSDGVSDPHLVNWARQNVSAHAVAERASNSIAAAIRTRRTD